MSWVRSSMSREAAAMKKSYFLLEERFNSDEFGSRVAGRFKDSEAIVEIIIKFIHKGFDKLRRNELSVMTIAFSQFLPSDGPSHTLP